MAANLAPEPAAFKNALKIFPTEPAEALGKMVQRIFSFVGKLSASHAHGVDPDGFDGVEQRGEYHRLLTSEWLLAEEAPEEFLRRAAMNEHVFLRLARREPRKGRRCLVFFDAGPMQLGSPRLVHLAVLMALEHRARQAGAAFSWTVIQNPGHVGEAVAESDVRTLLKERSAAVVDASMTAALLDAFESPQQGDDIWWVGAEGLEGLPGSTLTITDELLEEADKLRLTLRQSENSRSVSLPLPPAAMRTRLMRNPFEKSTEHRPTPQNLKHLKFWLSFCGRYVFLREGLEVVHLQNLTFAGQRRSFLVQTNDGKLVAIARFKKSVATVRRNGGAYVLSVAGVLLDLVFEDRRPDPPLGKAPFWEIFVAGKHEKRLVVKDSVGTVYVGMQKGDQIPMRPVLDRCVRLVWRGGHIDYVCRTHDLNLEYGLLGLDFSLHPKGHGQSTRPVALAEGYDAATQQGIFAHAIPRTRESLESGESRMGYVTWRIQSNYAASTIFRVPETLTVVGLVRKSQHWFLLVLSEDCRAVQLLGDSSGNRKTTVQEFSQPVDRWQMAPTRSSLVFEQGGRLMVAQFQDGQETDIRYLDLPKLGQVPELSE